jgi:hypothetical protein
MAMINQDLTISNDASLELSNCTVQGYQIFSHDEKVCAHFHEYNYADLPFLAAGPAFRCMSCKGFIFDVFRENGVEVKDACGNRHELRCMAATDQNGYTVYVPNIDSTSQHRTEIYHPILGIVNAGEPITLTCKNCSSQYSVTVNGDGSLGVYGYLHDAPNKPNGFGINYSDNKNNSFACSQEANSDAIQEATKKAAEDHKTKIEEALNAAASSAVQNVANGVVDASVKRVMDSMFAKIVEEAVNHVRAELSPKPEPDPGKSIIT